VILRNGVTDMITAGRTASRVSRTMICIGALSEADPAGCWKETPNNAPGFSAAQAVAVTMIRKSQRTACFTFLTRPGRQRVRITE
jgi:hypothetical protein